MKRSLVVTVMVLVVLVVAGYGLWRAYGSRSSPAAYRTGEVKRTDIVSAISATGTLVPEDVVDIGAQVNGMIASFGADTEGNPVDYRSTVKEGQTLAKVDDAIYAAQVSADEASLAQAQASVLVAAANHDQAKARLDQSQRDWSRAEQLGHSEALAQADFDAARSALDQAVAALAVSDAQIGQSHAQVAIAEAALLRSRRNLLYCTIKSPVDGVIIDRRVEIGQTVVSSLNAPSLFLIAKDLAKMLVLVQVNEADIGHVKPGDAVTFRADALPGEQFSGEVRKVRLNATMTQNVVTYTVEIVTSNADLKLLPYLTANVTFVIDQRRDVIAVPNAALRWSPAGAGASDVPPASASRARQPDAGESTAPPRGDHSRERPRGGRPASRVWVLRQGKPEAIVVVAGLSDGSMTEVTSDELREGDEVIVGQAGVTAASNGTTNPFAPTPMRRGGGTGSGGGGR
ncbi:MAG: efflux RND transporter periplasmic adaptor subunit [Phycisphaerales bacterium]